MSRRGSSITSPGFLCETSETTPLPAMRNPGLGQRAAINAPPAAGLRDKPAMTPQVENQFLKVPSDADEKIGVIRKLTKKCIIVGAVKDISAAFGEPGVAELV